MRNVSVSAVQKWESPSSGKHLSGAAAKLLQLIDKRGLAAILAWWRCGSGGATWPHQTARFGAPAEKLNTIYFVAALAIFYWATGQLLSEK